MGTMTISHVAIQATPEDLAERAIKLQTLRWFDYRKEKATSPLHSPPHIPSISREKKGRGRQIGREGREGVRTEEREDRTGEEAENKNKKGTVIKWGREIRGAFLGYTGWLESDKIALALPKKRAMLLFSSSLQMSSCPHFIKDRGLCLFFLLDLRMWCWFEGGIMVRHQTVTSGQWWQERLVF